MTIDPDKARITRLLAARDRLEAQLADHTTPPYSIAPLSNQLRLTDKEIDRIERRNEDDNAGLPTTPDEADVLDFYQYRYLFGGPASRRARRVEGSAWGGRQRAIFESWHEAGFVVPIRPDRDDASPDQRRHDLRGWVDRCRAELTRCLDEATP